MQGNLFSIRERLRGCLTIAIDLGVGTCAVDLLPLLPSGGGMSLLGAGLIGLFLANRVLAPVRLAWNKEQCFIADAAVEATLK